MELQQHLLDHFNRTITLSSAAESDIVAIAASERIKKRQYIDQPGFVSQYRNYVVTGAFRSFFLDHEGKEHTVQIAVDDWFVSDFYSYITKSPATLFVEALEDSVILRMPYDRIEPLCAKHHSISEFFRITTEKAFAYSRNRALSNISKTAEERYREFLAMYPAITQRVPQRVIASYLGMTPEFLSKIRKSLI